MEMTGVMWTRCPAPWSSQWSAENTRVTCMGRIGEKPAHSEEVKVLMTRTSKPDLERTRGRRPACRKPHAWLHSLMGSVDNSYCTWQRQSAEDGLGPWALGLGRQEPTPSESHSRVRTTDQRDRNRGQNGTVGAQLNVTPHAPHPHPRQPQLDRVTGMATTVGLSRAFYSRTHL